MKIKCFFGHKWKCINIFPYMDISFGARIPSIYYTLICNCCGKIKSKYIYGCCLTQNDCDKLHN